MVQKCYNQWGITLHYSTCLSIHCCLINGFTILTGEKPLEMIKEPLLKEDIATEETLARLVMYNPCRSDHDVIVWKAPLQYAQ